jgi:hypothetical protein
VPTQRGMDATGDRALDTGREPCPLVQHTAGPALMSPRPAVMVTTLAATPNGRPGVYPPFTSGVFTAECHACRVLAV